MNRCCNTLVSKQLINLKFIQSKANYSRNRWHHTLCSLSSQNITGTYNSKEIKLDPSKATLQFNKKNAFIETNINRTIRNSLFSTSATATSPAPQTNSNNDSTSKEDDSNIFLDNLGKVFFVVIFAIIFLLVRSSRGTTNKANLREYLESISLLDPCEIDDLRVANSLFTPDVFRDVMKYVLQNHSGEKIKYSEFLSLVKHRMMELKGDEFTIQLGHLLDRVVIYKLENGHVHESEEDDELLRLDFLFTLLSLALSCSVEERVDILYEIMSKTPSPSNEDITSTVSKEDIIQMVQNLQDTYQLDNDAQILDIPEEKYPFQQYKKGVPQELLQEARKEYNEKFGIKLKEGSSSEFDALLRSQYICAWGECYGHRKLQKQK